MGSFNAKGLVEPLAYSGLSDFGIPDGVIVEPSNALLSEFLESIQDLQRASDAETTPDGETPLTGEDVLKKACEVTSRFCSGTPTAEQFESLPPRLFREFVKWLASEFIDPKG